MNQTNSERNESLVTSGTSSWREGVEDERELLADFLENVAATETIQIAIGRAVEAMRLRRGSRVLDVGCGTGVMFPALAGAIGATGRIVGLDHGSGFLGDARKRSVDLGFSKQLELVRADAHALPFDEHTFDAAHTERVLMHLSYPDRALRELRRVVRRGGWIVCVEPDLIGMRVDHSNPEHAALVVTGFCASIQNPAIGLELNRRFANAGLVDRRVDVLTEVERDFPADVEEFFARAASTSVKRGWLTQGDAELAIAAMRQAGEAGCYISYSSMFIVSGKVPESG